MTEEFERRLEKKEISERHAGSMAETIKKLRARFGKEHLKLLEGSMVKAWLAHQPLAVKTRNRHLGYIKNMFGIAQEWNLLEVDPFAKVAPFNDPLARRAKITILTPEELTKFLNAADPDFIPFFTINAFTGLRREEVIRLDWSEVKLDRNRIDLPFEKSKNRRRKLIVRALDSDRYQLIEKRDNKVVYRDTQTGEKWIIEVHHRNG